MAADTSIAVGADDDVVVVVVVVVSLMSRGPENVFQGKKTPEIFES